MGLLTLMYNDYEQKVFISYADLYNGSNAECCNGFVQQ